MQAASLFAVVAACTLHKVCALYNFISAGQAAHGIHATKKNGVCAGCIFITSNKAVCATIALQATVLLLFQLHFFTNSAWFMLFVSGCGLWI